MKPVAEQDYQLLVELLDRLTDKVGEDENHPLASLMDVLGVLIQKYENELQISGSDHQSPITNH
jgi:HTH-type transcriptional regulator/antitoxin HigA